MNRRCISPLAQLVERETVNLEAAGSIPAWRAFFFFLLLESARGPMPSLEVTSEESQVLHADVLM